MRDISWPRQYQPSATNRSAIGWEFFEAVQAVMSGLVTNSEAPAELRYFRGIPQDFRPDFRNEAALVDAVDQLDSDLLSN